MMNEPDSVVTTSHGQVGFTSTGGEQEIEPEQLTVVDPGTADVLTTDLDKGDAAAAASMGSNNEPVPVPPHETEPRTPDEGEVLLDAPPSSRKVAEKAFGRGVSFGEEIGGETTVGTEEASTKPSDDNTPNSPSSRNTGGNRPSSLDHDEESHDDDFPGGPGAEPSARKANLCLATGKHGARSRLAKEVTTTRRTSDVTGNTESRYEIMMRKMFPDKEAMEKADAELRTSMHGRLQVTANVLEDADSPLEGQVYRLQAVQSAATGPAFLRWLGLGHHISIYEEAEQNSNSWFNTGADDFVIKYLHWTFRSSFAAVFLSAALLYFVQAFLFAAFIWWLGKNKPACIGGVDFTNHSFADAFALSWQTFLTVGLGAVHPALSSEDHDIKQCTGVTIVVVSEAFVGMLFCSMITAIMFAKISRIQSFAQVIFSDPILIRYGSGVAIEKHDHSNGESSSDDDGPDKEHPIPCPVLEFRINNRLHSVRTGEIIDSSVTMVASIDAHQACPTVRSAASRRKKRGKHHHHHHHHHHHARTTSESSMMSMMSMRSILDLSVHANSNMNQSFAEDPSGKIIPKRIFAKLELESPKHPFFKRVWIVRHTLDQNSPLLRGAARQLLKKNNGNWPKELNNYEGVRASIHFDQLLVSFSGTSNADANSVYGQKVYEFVNVAVGYSFVNQLYRDDHDGSLGVDTRLINDVVEQHGGGGEPLSVERPTMLGMDILI